MDIITSYLKENYPLFTIEINNEDSKTKILSIYNRRKLKFVITFKLTQNFYIFFENKNKDVYFYMPLKDKNIYYFEALMNTLTNKNLNIIPSSNTDKNIRYLLELKDKTSDYSSVVFLNSYIKEKKIRTKLKHYNLENPENFLYNITIKYKAIIYGEFITSIIYNQNYGIKVIDILSDSSLNLFGIIKYIYKIGGVFIKDSYFKNYKIKFYSIGDIIIRFKIVWGDTTNILIKNCNFTNCMNYFDGNIIWYLHENKNSKILNLENNFNLIECFNDCYRWNRFGFRFEGFIF